MVREGGGGGIAHSWVEIISYAYKEFCCLQIFVAAYKMFTSLKIYKGGGAVAPQRCWLQIVTALTNLSGKEKFSPLSKSWSSWYIFMLGEGEGKFPDLVKNSSPAYKLSLLLTNFWCCLQIFGLLQKHEGRGWASPPTLLLTISLAAEYIVHSRAWSHAFKYIFFGLVAEVQQGIDPWGPKSETECFTIVPSWLGNELIPWTYILYFSSS